jgi:hypothetical protein
LGSILEDTENIYQVIVKAAGVAKSTGIGDPETGYLPVENFTEEEARE